jgi:hypothetical protein
MAARRTSAYFLAGMYASVFPKDQLLIESYQNLPDLALIEGIQQVAMKPDESLSPSLFTFRLHFAAIHHH